MFTLVGLLLVGVAGVAVGYPLWWQHRSDVTAQHLLHEHLRSATGSSGTVAASCHPVLPGRSSRNDHLAGVLEVPRLSLTAPVLQGLGDPVLNVAVGHDPASPWPGSSGESVVLAHDVSYFARIGALKAGDEVIWRNACSAVQFDVTGTEVVSPGTRLQAPANDRGLALVTCYPANALFWTSERYVVLTRFVRSTPDRTSLPKAESVTHLVVPAPSKLLAEGLTLQDNPIPLGTMTVSGQPSAAWEQGPSPLDVEADALESLFGAEKAIAADDRTWWKDLAVPGLAMPAAWSNGATYYVTIDVSGSTVRSVELGSADVFVRLVVRSGALLIASVTPA